MKMKRVNLIAAVSLEHGLKAVYTTLRSPNSKLVFKILPQIISDGRHCVVLADNVGLHPTDYTIQRFEVAGAPFIFNVRYSPNLNGLEKCFK